MASTFAELDSAAAAMVEAPETFKSGNRRREYRDNRLEWMMTLEGIAVVLEGLRARNIRFSWPDPS